MANKETVLAMLASFTPVFEGFRSHPYFCPAGVATIGMGSTRYADGTQVRIVDDPISYEAAMKLMLHEFEHVYVPAVLTLCPVEMTNNQLVALADFTYNLGVDALRTSTLRKKVNAGQWSEVPAQLMRWVYAESKELPGLKARRQAEVKLLCADN